MTTLATLRALAIDAYGGALVIDTYDLGKDGYSVVIHDSAERAKEDVAVTARTESEALAMAAAALAVRAGGGR